jgi:hypothetical protein
MERPDCRAALDGGNMEKVGDVFLGDSTTGAAGTGTVTSVLMIEASSDLGAIDAFGVGTRKGVLVTSCGNVILGRYDVGLGDCGVEGLVKWTSSGLTHPSGFPESLQGVTLLLYRGDGNGGMYIPPIPPTLAGSWGLLISASEEFIRRGDGLCFDCMLIGSEDTLPFRLEGYPAKLLAEDPGFGVLLQSVKVAFGASLYEGVGELGLDWATPPV